jgi:hypothetical protein
MTKGISCFSIDSRAIKWMRGHGYKTLEGKILEETSVEEEYDPNPNLLQKGDDEYLLTKRIELDSIVQEVGADALWDYMVFQLNSEFPEFRDYRKVMEEPDPENYYTQEIDDLLDYIHNYFKGVYNPKWKEIKQIASKVKGLAQVHYEESVNDIELKEVVHADEGTKKISGIFKKLLESNELPKIPKIEEEKEDDNTVSQPKSTVEESHHNKIDIEKQSRKVVNSLIKDLNSRRNHHAEIKDKIDEKLEGGSKSTEETNSPEPQNDNIEPTLDGSDLSILIKAFTEKYPNLPKNDLKEMLNGISHIVKYYRITKAYLASTIKGTPAERQFQKEFNDAQSKFKQMQHILASLNIHMDSNGNIDGKWIWGKLVDKK